MTAVRNLAITELDALARLSVTETDMTGEHDHDR